MKNRQWLLNQFEIWRREGLADEGTIARLSAYYARQPKSRSLPLIIFGSLGALLVGLGVIALLAANWDAFSRPLRTLIAFTPLTFCVMAYLYHASTKRTWSRGFFEPLGIFWTLAVGTAMAIIAQTYHLSHDGAAFTLTWTLLLLPVIAATRALVPTVGYFAGLLVWICILRGGSVAGYWPLAALACPFLIAERRANPTSVRVSLMDWGAIACSVAALGVSLEKRVPGLWMLIYSSVFSLLLLYGVLKENRQDSRWLQPGLLWGGGGLAVLLFLLTFSWVWNDAGFYYRSDAYCHAWARGWYDLVLAGGLPLAVLAILLKARRKGLDWLTVVWSAAPFVVAVMYAIAASRKAGWCLNVAGAAFLMLCYFLLLGILTLVRGISTNSLAKINVGTLMLLAVILQKFFTQNMPFTVKGVVFILAGLTFLAVNLFIARRNRAREVNHE